MVTAQLFHFWNLKQSNKKCSWGVTVSLNNNGVRFGQMEEWFMKAATGTD